MVIYSKNTPRRANGRNGKEKGLESQKKGSNKTSVLLKHSGMKQNKIAKKLNASTQTVSAVKKKLELGRKIAREMENVDENEKQP